MVVVMMMMAAVMCMTAVGSVAATTSGLSRERGDTHDGENEQEPVKHDALPRDSFLAGRFTRSPWETLPW